MCRYRVSFCIDVWWTDIGPLILLALQSWQGGLKLLKIIFSYWALSLDYYYYYYYYYHHHHHHHHHHHRRRRHHLLYAGYLYLYS